MKTNYRWSYGIIAALTMLTSACTTTIQMNLTRPAEINLKNVQVIAVADLEGGQYQHAKDLTGKFTAVLTESGYFKSVLDRQNLAGMMKEQNLGFTGFVDDESVVRIGKFIGAGVLVFGRITLDEYHEDVKSETVQVYDSNNNKYINVNRRTRTGEYSLSVHVQITDAENARILGAKDFNAKFSDSTQADNAKPAALDQNTLYDECTQELAEKFKRFIVPYKESIAVYLETDSKLPEVDTAATLLNAGETEQALDLLSGASDRDFSDPNIKAKILYDYGIVLVYTGDFDDGAAKIKAALRLNPGNQMYPEALITAKTEKQNAQKLKDQMERN